MSPHGLCCLVALAGWLALLHGADCAKVAFPEGGAAQRPAAAPVAAAESRLLADTDGVFGVTAGQSRNLGGPSVFGLGPARRRPDCPDCHPSVYRYCSDLLLHDACCCLRDSQPLPPQCQQADCSFLHAKSCYEHALITRCCCDRRLF